MVKLIVRLLKLAETPFGRTLERLSAGLFIATAVLFSAGALYHFGEYATGSPDSDSTRLLTRETTLVIAALVFVSGSVLLLFRAAKRTIAEARRPTLPALPSDPMKPIFTFGLVFWAAIALTPGTITLELGRFFAACTGIIAVFYFAFRFVEQCVRKVNNAPSAITKISTSWKRRRLELQRSIKDEFKGR